MKKEILLLLTLIFFGCQNEKNDIRLIDFVPKDPLLIIKYESNTGKEKFNQNFNNLINIKNDSVLKNFSKDEVLISYHKIGKKNIIPIYFTSLENKNVDIDEIIDSIFYSGSLIKRIGNEKNYKFTTQKNNFHIESKSKLLVENSIRKTNQVFKTHIISPTYI